MIFLLVAQLAIADTYGARHAAYAPDGRLTIAIHGDIWLRASGTWTQLTSGVAWDSDPAWTSDGASIVFSSTITGNGDLYRISPSSGSPAERLTTSDEPEAEPSVARDGTIAFVRGRGNRRRIWLRKPDGSEQRMTKGEAGEERWPAFSPDAQRIAYSVDREDRTRLRIRTVANDSDRVVIEDRDAEHPAWSPAGDQLLFSTRNGRAGVWLTTGDGRYVNLVSAQRAEAAWAPDGKTLALTELPYGDLGYNGDPDRLGDRDRRDDLSTTGRLWFVAAPQAPDVGLAASTLPEADRPVRNSAVVSAFFGRMDTLYFSNSPTRHAQWDAMRNRFLSRARTLASDAAIEELLHDALRERPTLRDPARGRAAVSSAHPVATDAGLEILRKGGNVVDAAVAVSFALGVVEPDASGLGGYGQMLVRLRDMNEPGLVEFMTRAPEDASLSNASLLRRGSLPQDGPVLANVPGTLAGMELAWKKYGSKKVKWADIVAPAIRAAEEGYVVSEGLATTLATEREHFLKYPSSRALFFRNGQPLHAGDTLRNPDLARTLRAIADSGAAAFYKGDIAQRLVRDLRGQGNAIQMSDMAHYFAAEREPVKGTYRGYTLYSSAPPVSGGATLVAQLNLLEQQNATKLYTDDASSLHAVIESWKLVPSSRGRIADPGLWPVNIDPLISKDTARMRWRCFSATKALQPNDLRGEPPPCMKATSRVSLSDTTLREDASPCSDHALYETGRFCHRTGTTAFTVADAEGNVVSVTQTLGTWGGNFYVTPGLGFIYNDKLGSYGSDPDEYGSRLPNARHGSTLAPTIAFRGEGAQRRPVLSTAAAGNNWITSAVFSTTVGVLDAKLDAQHAIELPRFQLSQQRNSARTEYTVLIENGFSPATLNALRAMGHVFQPITLPGELRMGYAATITFGEKDVMAGADPRRSGAAGAVP